MSELVHEIRIALRAMARDKSFALPVLLTLTLCLAANAVVFTVVRLGGAAAAAACAEPERLVWVTNSYPKAGWSRPTTAFPTTTTARAVAAFEELALYGQAAAPSARATAPSG